MASASASETPPVSKICQVYCDDEEDYLGIVSSSVHKPNDILAIRHLSRVTVIHDNKLLVTLLYPSAVMSVQVCHQQKTVTVWTLISCKKFYHIDISKYILREQGDNVFDDLLGNNTETGLPSVIHVDDAHCFDLDVNNSVHFCMTDVHLITLEENSPKTLSCSLWPDYKSKDKLTPQCATYRHIIARHDFDMGKLVICPVRSEANDSHKEIHGKNTLDKNLYNGLFGLNQSLVDSVLVLIGTPSGIIWSVSTHNDYRPQQICDLSQPVIGIVCISGEDTNMCKTIAMVGESGKVMTIQHTDDGLLYQNWHTTSPVLDVTASQNYMIHSTGYGLFVTDFNQLDDDCSPRPCMESAKILLSNVRHLVAYCDTKGIGDTQGTQIAGLTNKGDVLNIRLELTRCKKEVTTGQDMKELVTSFSMMTQQLKNLQQKLNSQDQVLSQISLASNIVAGQKNSYKAFPNILACRQSVKSTHHGSHVSHKVSLTLHNISDAIFHEGWKWIVTIQPKHAVSLNCHSSQYCVTLGQLRPGEFRSVDMDLNYDLLEDLPLRTNFHLLYTNNSQSIPVKIPVSLSAKELNILHFLSTSAHLRNDSVYNVIKAAAQKSQESSETEKPASSRTFSSTMTVSKETCMKSIHSSTDAEKDTTPEHLLLKYIMSESDVQVPANSANILLKFVGKNYLTINIDVEHHRSHSVHLQSTNIAVLSSARLAITDKLKALKSSDQTEGATLDKKGLSSSLKKIHDIQEKCSKIGKMITGGLDSAKMTEELLDLYENLRKVSIPL